MLCHSHQVWSHDFSLVSEIYVKRSCHFQVSAFRVTAWSCHFFFFFLPLRTSHVSDTGCNSFSPKWYTASAERMSIHSGKQFKHKISLSDNVTFGVFRLLPLHILTHSDLYVTSCLHFLPVHYFSTHSNLTSALSLHFYMAIT